MPFLLKIRNACCKQQNQKYVFQEKKKQNNVFENKEIFFLYIFNTFTSISEAATEGVQ